MTTKLNSTAMKAKALAEARRKHPDEAHQARSVEKRTRKPDVDPNTMFDLVKKSGGYQAVADLLESRGLMNPKTRKPYTKASIKRFCQRADGFAQWEAARQGAYKEFGKKLEEINDEVEEGAHGQGRAGE